MIGFEEFKKIEMVAARIIEAEDHPNADRLYVLKVDIAGESRQLVAGIKQFYTKEELIGKKVIVLNNLEPAVIRGVESKGMLLVVRDENTLAVLTHDREVAAGSPVS